jgi:oxygen-independent coproporphyrinogen-3 oxidase
LNIYIHFPYCEMKCGFCNLFTITQHNSGTLGLYADALVREIRMFANRVEVRGFQVGSVYFGGGTPTLLPHEAMEKIVRTLREVFRFSADAEMSIESAPNAIEASRLSALLKLGFGRFSIGIQTFHEGELLTMGRPYRAHLGPSVTSAALAAGFKNVNVDLIYGLPGQNEQTWLENITTAIGLGVPTVSIYPLALRSRTPFGHRFEQAPNEFLTGSTLYALYDIAADTFSSNGYRQLTASAFARNGGGNRHEANEFCGTPTLGLGVAALSYAPDIHYTNINYLDTRSTAGITAGYLEAIRTDQLPFRSSIVVDEDESRRRHVILRLLSSGLDRTKYSNRFGESVTERFNSEFDALRLERCIEEAGGQIVLSRRGRGFSSLVADLFASERVKQLSESYK